MQPRWTNKSGTSSWSVPPASCSSSDSTSGSCVSVTAFRCWEIHRAESRADLARRRSVRSSLAGCNKVRSSIKIAKALFALCKARSRSWNRLIRIIRMRITRWFAGFGACACSEAHEADGGAVHVTKRHLGVSSTRRCPLPLSSIINTI